MLGDAGLSLVQSSYLSPIAKTTLMASGIALESLKSLEQLNNKKNQQVVWDREIRPNSTIVLQITKKYLAIFRSFSASTILCTIVYAFGSPGIKRADFKSKHGVQHTHRRSVYKDLNYVADFQSVCPRPRDKRGMTVVAKGCPLNVLTAEMKQSPLPLC